MATPTSGKTYTIKNIGTSRMLNLYYTGSVVNQLNVVIYNADGSDEQKWKYNGSKLLTVRNTAYCLDRFRGASAKENADIYLATSDDDADQKLTIVQDGTTGNYKIRLTSDSTKWLTANAPASGAAGGTSTGKATNSPGNVYFAASSNSDNQKWYFAEVTPPSTGNGNPTVGVNPPSSIDSTNILQRYNNPLSFTGTSSTRINIKSVCTGSPNEDFHCGSGFRSTDTGKTLANAYNGSALATRLTAFAKYVYSQTNTPSIDVCGKYLFGEHDSTFKFHHGVDLHVGHGLPIRCFWGGEVLAIEGGLGRVSIYVPELDVTTTYLHMSNIPASILGTTISRGTNIGKQSNVCDVTIGTHLHFEVRKGRTTVLGSYSTSADNKALTSIVPYGYMVFS